MKTFHETFKDRIDMTNGTAVIDEKKYKEIQRDVLQHALKVMSTGVDSYIIRNEIQKLLNE